MINNFIRLIQILNGVIETHLKKNLCVYGYPPTNLGKILLKVFYTYAE